MKRLKLRHLILLAAMSSPEVIVVVDWNFSHLAETPNSPEPYTPEWLRTNSP